MIPAGQLCCSELWAWYCCQRRWCLFMGNCSSWSFWRKGKTINNCWQGWRSRKGNNNLFLCSQTPIQIFVLVQYKVQSMNCLSPFNWDICICYSSLDICNCSLTTSHRQGVFDICESYSLSSLHPKILTCYFPCDASLTLPNYGSSDQALRRPEVLLLLAMLLA